MELILKAIKSLISKIESRLNSIEPEVSQALDMVEEGVQSIQGKMDMEHPRGRGAFVMNGPAGFDPGVWSFTEGFNSTAYGERSHAEGYKTAATGVGSHSEGNDTNATGDNSHAEGSGTESGGTNSHAEGSDTWASGPNSHAEGKLSRATGENSHAEGNNTVAEGTSSHAEGVSTKVYGNGGHAEGNGTSVYGDGGHAEGLNNTVHGSYQHVEGKYSIVDKASKYAHIVGNGTSSGAPSNAHTLDWDGNAWFQGAVYVGGAGQDDAAAVKLVSQTDLGSVIAMGANGDGTTDDTEAFQNALAARRRVFVPGGTYRLTGELVVGDNCELELAQDVVLKFEQTSGNCITLNRSASLVCNHATVIVTHEFSGNVINVDARVHEATDDVLPFEKWDPQWKTGRYLTNLNICRRYSTGHFQSFRGEYSGTAVYIYTDDTKDAQGNRQYPSMFIWGLNFSGLRIAGAFEYGIRAYNVAGAWNHEMHLEAFIDACHIGISLENCNNAYIVAAIQPRHALEPIPGTSPVKYYTYAKHGLELRNSKNAELSGLRVWDWNESNSLWTYDKSNINQHIAMYGDCEGAILNDYRYYSLPSGFNDLRELIYTDTPANFDSLIILQEPFTRWFKPLPNAENENEPYFQSADNSTPVRLALKSEVDEIVDGDYVAMFTDRLASAKNIDGSGIFNEIGYRQGYLWATDGKTLTASNWHTCTGLIGCQPNSVINVKGMSFATGNEDCRIVLYDANRNKLVHVNRDNIINNASYYHVKDYAATDDGFSITIVNGSAAYITFSVYTSTVSAHPVVAVDEQIAYEYVGALSSSIKVNEANIIGMEKYERVGRMVTAITANSTDDQYPTAKAVYDAIQAYVDDSILGGAW